MVIAAKVLADSIAFSTRLVTLEITCPRIILAEFNTHRAFSRNSASSRAIPVETRCAVIEREPFVPLAFGRNQRGMQAGELLDALANATAEAIWREAATDAVKHARRLAEVGAHKQHANRLAETYAWTTIVVTSTEFDNWRALRRHADAQPEIQGLAEAMDAAMEESTPQLLAPGDWHLPYIDWETAGAGHSSEVLRAISVARCCAVSYERQGDEKTIDQYQALYLRLLKGGHMSPFEHPAKVVAPVAIAPENGEDIYGPPFGVVYTAAPDEQWAIDGYFCGNVRAPFVQLRKFIVGEHVFQGGQ